MMCPMIAVDPFPPVPEGRPSAVARAFLLKHTC